MKICFIAPKGYQLFKPEVKSTFGGAEVQLSLLAKEIAKKKDYDVHFIVADYGQEDVEERKGVTLWKSLDFNDSFLKQIFSFLKTFNKVNADVYVQRTLTLQSGLIALYSKLKRKKFVYMVAHDREADGTHELYSKFLTGFFARLVFRFADTIFVQNNYELEYLSKDFSGEKIFLLKKGLNIEKLASKKKKKYDAIWVGRAEKWKNPEIFLKLAKDLPDKNFLMIIPPATGKEGYFKKVFQKAKKIENLECIDFLENKEIYKKLNESKLFILTSEKEGDWPMTVLEATACGLPVLSYKLDYDFLTDEYEGGFSYDGDFESLKKDFLTLSSSSTALKAYSKNAYRYAKENHDIKVNVGKFLEILSK